MIQRRRLPLALLSLAAALILALAPGTASGCWDLAADHEDCCCRVETSSPVAAGSCCDQRSDGNAPAAAPQQQARSVPAAPPPCGCRMGSRPAAPAVPEDVQAGSQTGPLLPTDRPAPRAPAVEQRRSAPMAPTAPRRSGAALLLLLCVSQT